MSNLQLTRNMRILRKKNNMTQQELSDELNISRQAYSNYETGRRDIPIDLLVAMADYFSLTIDDLIRQTISPCKGDGIIRERKNHYFCGVEKGTSNTIYLTKKEVTFILGYRELPEANKVLVDKIIDLSPRRVRREKH